MSELNLEQKVERLRLSLTEFRKEALWTVIKESPNQASTDFVRDLENLFAQPTPPAMPPQTMVTTSDGYVTLEAKLPTQFAETSSDDSQYCTICQGPYDDCEHLSCAFQRGLEKTPSTSKAGTTKGRAGTSVAGPSKTETSKAGEETTSAIGEAPRKRRKLKKSPMKLFCNKKEESSSPEEQK
uniref:Uncharacterized protein n=1 Tax=Globodera rostochiensis TaxID=31243 RepID=A0A914HR10_GLORO